MRGLIRRWIERLFLAFKKDPRARRFNWPTKEDITLLPPFAALELDGIVEVAAPGDAQRAYREIMAESVVGFDTESKPTFVKGEVSTGPHVAQFATLDRAYVFMLHDRECLRVAGKLIGSKTLKKVGFGLSGDLRQVRNQLGVEPGEVLDLESLFAERGYGRGVGVKVGVAIALKRRFSKSRKASTSNWKQRRLTDKQILYAANDAFAAIRVFHALTTAR
jgi:hypothetical protein